MKTTNLNIKLVTVLAASAILSSCDKDETLITLETLPAAAQEVVKTNFDTSKITHVIFEDEFIGAEYQVLFSDGTEIDFDKNGTWDNIEAPGAGVPSALVPEKILAYVETNYAEQKITSIDKESHGYDVEVNNFTELEFDGSGNFKRVDND